MLDKPELAWQSADGQSALYCGDAFDLMAAIPDNSVDCIWTDPPYLLSNDGVTCIAGRRVSVNKGEWDRSGGIENDHEFNLSWLQECHRILKPAGTNLGNRYTAYLPQRWHGNDAVRIPYLERHHLGKDQSAAEPGLSLFCPLYRDHLVGYQSAER